VRRWVILSLFAMMLAILACGSEAPTPSQHTVVYRVTGNIARASLTYESGEGSTEQRTVNVPWEIKFTVEQGQFLYLSAQNEENRGIIMAEILLDGKEWKKATSDGAYVIATVSGRIGE